MSENEKKVHSILMGRKVRKFYRLPTTIYNENAKLEEATETLERVKIGEYELPLLTAGNEIWLDDYDVYTTIQKVSASTNGDIYYNVSAVADIVDDLDKTEKELTPMLQREISEYLRQKEKDKAEEKERKAKVDKIVKERELWQHDNVDKIQGIVVYKLPINDRGQTPFTHQQQDFMYVNMLSAIPREFIVLSTPCDVDYIDFSGGKIKLEKNNV